MNLFLNYYSLSPWVSLYAFFNNKFYVDLLNVSNYTIIPTRSFLQNYIIVAYFL